MKKRVLAIVAAVLSAASHVAANNTTRPTVTLPNTALTLPATELKIPSLEFKVPAIKPVHVFSPDAERMRPPILNVKPESMAIRDVKLAVPSRPTFKLKQDGDFAGNVELFQSSMAAFNRTHFATSKSFNVRNPFLLKWKAVYADTYAPIVKVPLQSNLRMVAEVRAPANDAEYDNYTQELDYFTSKGYNALLVAWYAEDDYTKLDRVIEYAKSKKLTVFFAYGGSEVWGGSAYAIDPDTYAAGLRYLASKTDGFLLSWRGTCQDTILKPDAKWVGFTLSNVRAGDATIPVLGGLFYFHGLRDLKIAACIPEGVSGIMVQNVGIKNINYDAVMKKVLAPYDLPKIIMVVGERYFYMTQNKTDKTKDQNRTICHTVEQRFVAAGASGTLTVAGDESAFNNLKTSVTDNLCQTSWRRP